jgi:hypothetical protein
MSEATAGLELSSIADAAVSDDPYGPFAVASGATMLFMTQITRGGVVFSGDLALKLAEALCEFHYGKEELARQSPLTVADKDTYWRVEGNWNRDGKTEGPGAFFVSIEKHDGRVTDFGKWFPYHAHSSVVPLIKRHLARRKPTDSK